MGIGATGDGAARVFYSGPGRIRYSWSNEAFAFTVNDGGKTLVEGKGSLTPGESKTLIEIAAQSSCDWEIELLGFAPDAVERPQEQCNEVVRIEPGKRQLSFERVQQWDYDCK
ncbi:MAG: hypothetical protein ABFD92_15630 [Planctomycetaceae bacterium]|nr:hypothetical protein [Planctomycetaceae bacterium]